MYDMKMDISSSSVVNQKLLCDFIQKLISLLENGYFSDQMDKYMNETESYFPYLFSTDFVSIKFN